MSYTVRPGQRIWHTKDEKYVEEGESVSLTHLSQEDRQKLVDAGVVEQATASNKAEKKGD
jgi:hypothetical protein